MGVTRIIIIGGGFAGVKCARTLRRKLPPESCEIVLFSRENNMVFYPLLAEVAGAAINPLTVTVPNGGSPADPPRNLRSGVRRVR